MDTSNQILKRINQKIYYRRNDTLLNHLKTYFQFDKINFSGDCNDAHFCIWKYSAWTGLFYTVILGKVCAENNKTIITLKTKLNSAGLLLSVLIFLLFFFALPDFQLSTVTITNTFFRLAFAFLPLIAIGLGYFHQTKKTLDEIHNIVKSVYQ
jgi:hypothetical protein